VSRKAKPSARPSRPAPPQHRAEQGLRANQVEPDDQTRNDEDEADGTRDQFGEETVGGDAVPDPGQSGEGIADKANSESDGHRDPDKGKDPQDLFEAPLKRAQRIGAGGQREVALQRAVDGHDA